jgi:hypothetical protein
MVEAGGFQSPQEDNTNDMSFVAQQRVAALATGFYCFFFLHSAPIL